MPVPYCFLCQNDPTDSRSNQPGSTENGDFCPICHNPTCRNHLSTVRWRWRRTGLLDSARICLDCKNAYRHRDWDPTHRDWIS